MKTRNSNIKQGFTLVEMMVALTVGAAVMILILSSFRSLSTSMAATEHYKDMHHDVRHAMDVMQRDITSGSGVSQCIASNKLTLNTTGFGSTGSVAVVYNLSNNVLSRTAGAGLAQTLATGVSKVTFALYDASGAITADSADAYFVGVDMEIKTQGVRNTYMDKLQIRNRMRVKGL